MPKKQPRNAFYFFMQDYREEQRKLGVNYQTMAQVADAAGPLWKVADHKTREKFEEKAQREKQKLNQPNTKFTSQGVSFAVIEQREKEMNEADEIERREIMNIVKLKAFSGELVHEVFFLMDVNCYCQVHADHVVAEMTILRFSLAEGIIDQYHEIVNPGDIPLGYNSDARAACAELGLRMPEDMPDEPRADYIQLLANVVEYVGYAGPPPYPPPPPLYTMPAKVAACASLLQQLCTLSAQDECMFRVHRVDRLMFHLVNAHRAAPGEGFPRESLALLQLQKDTFDYNPGLACEHHEAGDRPNNCSLARAKRWAFTILDYVCPLAGLPQLPGRHLPADYDVENIQRYYEHKKTEHRAAPTVAHVASSSVSASANSSMVSFDDSFRARPAPPAPPARPAPAAPAAPAAAAAAAAASGSWAVSRRAAPPDLSDSDFPRLSVGAGRGRPPPRAPRTQ